MTLKGFTCERDVISFVFFKDPFGCPVEGGLEKVKNGLEKTVVCYNCPGQK